MQQRKLLVLDVEGTIITGYDFNAELKDDKFPAIIDEKLREVLKNFADANFEIVLATGTSGDNLDYYRNEFIKAGINTFIKKYCPGDHSDKDSKTDKLVKYAKEFNISDKQNIYFFDDAENNVKSAKESGFHNSFRVTDQNTLLQQLDQLSDTLGLKKISQFSSNANMFPPKKYSIEKEATSLPKKKDENSKKARCILF